MEGISEITDSVYDTVFGIEDRQHGRFSVLYADDLEIHHIHRFVLRYTSGDCGGGRMAGEPDTPDHVKEREDARERESHDREMDKNPSWIGHYKFVGKVDRDGNASVNANVGVSNGDLNLDAKLKADVHGNVSGEISAEGTF